MNTSTMENTCVLISLDRIVSKLPVRKLSSSGLKRIQDSMQRSGFLDNYPLVVASLGGDTYQLVDGNHCYESAKTLGITKVPVIVMEALEEKEAYKLYWKLNNAANVYVAKPEPNPVLRDTAIKKTVLASANHTCFVCGLRLCPPKGNFIQAHHLVPLAINGTDTVENCMAVCPNHHMILHSILGDRNELDRELWGYYQQALSAQEVKQIKHILFNLEVA